MGSGGGGSEFSVTGHVWDDNLGLGGCDGAEQSLIDIQLSVGLCGRDSDIVSRSWRCTNSGSK